MDYLLTGLYTALAVVVVLAALRANASRVACDKSARRMEAMRGRLISLEAAVDSIDRAHRKLSGRFYAERQSREEERPTIADVDGKEVWADDDPHCENYRLAQIEGPLSAAASCECDYCVRHREERRALKARFVPKTTADRLQAIKKGLGS